MDFNNYFTKVKFSQMMGLDLSKTQDIFEYLEKEMLHESAMLVNINEFNSLQENNTEDIDDAYNQGWHDAIEAVEYSLPTKYSRR